MFQETISIGTINERYIKTLSIFNTLLHTCSETMTIILGFYDCQREVGLASFVCGFRVEFAPEMAVKEEGRNNS